VKHKGWNKTLLLLLMMIISLMSFAQQQSFDPDALLKEGAAPGKLVNDYTGNTLTAEQIATLERKLVALDDSTFTQITVVIVPTIGGNTIADYNQALGRAWGVGNKQNNSGVVLLIAKDDRKLDIATGYGLEGALTDVTAKSIIDNIIVPNFKGNDYYRGIDQGTDAIVAAVKGEYNTPRKKSGRSEGSGRVTFVIIMVVIFLLLSAGGGGGKGGTFVSRRGAGGLSGPIFWPGGGGSGGWSGGGGGGGGFGGFGGGSFGGGGASGSW
jgi:uncharacterized protein